MIQFNENKKQLCALLDKYQKKGRITSDFCDNFKKSFDAETLRIGVVGVVKAGKSTLINALVFNDNVLPTGSTPTTVTLTEINYSDENYIEITFLAEKDIDIIRSKSKESSATGKIASDLIKTIENNANYGDFLGKTIRGSKWEELSSYISADGEYSGLVKNVRIGVNNPNIKGLTIVDTPGFNDPVESRGETTKKELSNCNVVLFIHCPNASYNSAELDMLETQISCSGIAGMIDIINQIDIIGDYDITKWQDYEPEYTDERDRSISDVADPELRKLIQSSKLIVVSAYMSLLGSMSQDKFTDRMREDYIDYKTDNTTSLKEQGDFYKYSRIGILSDELNRILLNKTELLSSAPKSTLKGQLQVILNNVENELQEEKNKLAIYQSQVQNIIKNRAEFDDTINKVLEPLKTPILSNIIIDKINQKELHLKDLRKQNAEKQFTEEYYLEPSLFTEGVNRRNLGNFNLFLCEFVDYIRIELQSLRSQLITESNQFVESVVNKLIPAGIEMEQRKLIQDALSASVSSALGNIYNIIQNETISERPKGGQLQYTLYYIEFLRIFDDDKIHSYLKDFYACAQELSSSIKIEASDRIGRIRQTILESSDMSPEAKNRIIKECSDNISNLSAEIEDIKKDIKILD